MTLERLDALESRIRDLVKLVQDVKRKNASLEVSSSMFAFPTATLALRSVTPGAPMGTMRYWRGSHGYLYRHEPPWKPLR